MSRPTSGTYPVYAETYVNLVDADSPKEAIRKYADLLISFFKNIPGEKYDYSYADGKWTIREVLQHIIDAERIFSSRALRIARADKTPLPGFDENAYAMAVADSAKARSWESLIEEFTALRKSTDLLIESFNDEQLQQTGITSDQPNTVNAICFTLYGHALHHKRILEERYL